MDESEELEGNGKRGETLNFVKNNETKAAME